MIGYGISAMWKVYMEDREWYFIIPGGAEVKASACNVGDLGSIPGLGRSPGEGTGNSLQYSCLRIPWMEKPCGLQFTGSQRVEHD